MNAMTKAKREFKSPKIRAVEPGDGDHVLRMTWEDGSVSRVDLTELVFRLRHLRPLRNRERFGQVAVADWGWAVSWGDDLDVSGETLWDMARQQAGAEMTPSRFRAWLETHDLTQQAAADLLGLSKRSVVYYATGALPITRILALAMRGAEAELPTARQRSAAKPTKTMTNSQGPRAVKSARTRAQRQRKLG